VITTFLLALATCAVWLPPIRVGGARVPPWLLLFLAAMGGALAAGALAPGGAWIIGALLALAWTASRAQGRWRVVLVVLTAVGALAVSLRPVKDIGHLAWPAALRLTHDAVAFTPSLNIGKASAGLFLFALLVPRLASVAELRRLWKPTLVIAAICTLVTVSVAVAMGYVRFDPKLPPEIAPLLASNLLFTCIAEEAFFRGLLQEGLHRLADRRGGRAGHAAAVLVSALAFGAVHVAGGPRYMVLATLGGLGNAVAYARARKVEASVFVHFALNAVHMIFFTYPALAR
jgi:membrane protease YdiL (CAAX protease family)